MENQEPNDKTNSQSEPHQYYDPANPNKGISPIASARIMRDVYIQFMNKNLTFDFEKADLFEKGYFFTLLQEVVQIENSQKTLGYETDNFTERAMKAMIDNTFEEFVKTWAPMPDFKDIATNNRTDCMGGHTLTTSHDQH